MRPRSPNDDFEKSDAVIGADPAGMVRRSGRMMTTDRRELVFGGCAAAA